MLKIDQTMSNILTTCEFFTDFGGTLDLSASEKDNASVNNHAVICIFFVLFKWRHIKFLKKVGNIQDEVIVNDTHKWIILGYTLSKGKKNDHVFHNSSKQTLNVK